MKGATTIVVGGGIIGAATAWELSRRGSDVLLLEAGEFGGQGTGRSAAIVRCHYSNPQVVRMAIRARETFRRLPLLLDCEPVYTRCGWLFLVDEADSAHALANAEMQEGEGLDTVEVDDLQAALPGVVEDGIAYALFEPDAGFADPVAATRAFIDAACRAGSRALDHSPVEALVLDGQSGPAVRVGGELVGADHVVLAAGPWSLQLGRGVGLELPLEVFREQDVLYETAPEPTLPCSLSSQIDRFYARPAPEVGEAALLIGRGFPKEYEEVDPDRYEEEVDGSFEADVLTRLSGRLPRLAGMRRVGGRVGLYDVTPDWHPILGPVEGMEGLFLATGGSGHCFKLGPAIGELVAGSILGLRSDLADIEDFSLARFEDGRELRSTYGGNRA